MRLHQTAPDPIRFRLTTDEHGRPLTVALDRPPEIQWFATAVLEHLHTWDGCVEINVANLRCVYRLDPRDAWPDPDTASARLVYLDHYEEAA